MNIKLSEIFQSFQPTGALTEMRGEDREITGIAPVSAAGPGDLVFAANKDFLAGAIEKSPAAIVTNAKLAESPALEKCSAAVLVSPNVELAHAWLKQKYMDRVFHESEWGRVHESAVVHESVKVPASCVIGPLAVIGKDVKLGENSVILARAVVEYEAEIGANSVIHPGAVIGYRCVIGANCVIKANTVIGSEGFGFAQDEKRKHHRIPQTGRVVIGDRVVVGALNTIDRAAYGETVIGAGTIFDNINHIAHNVELGEDCIVVAMTGIAGSTKVGDRVIFSGQTGVLDHLNIASDSVFLHRAGISWDVDKPGVYGWFPLVPIQDYLKISALLKKLPDLKRKVGRIEKRLEGGS
ncbi:MAG: UDP-3-O-(3-hydroxymyristoyl)glucosamine N-acyltransferase [Leptospirales bacterium]|jgi:UDP-3-O-[3-hydroxymyristoyl] glucosamine N-acyltransferase